MIDAHYVEGRWKVNTRKANCDSRHGQGNGCIQPFVNPSNMYSVHGVTVQILTATRVEIRNQLHVSPHNQSVPGAIKNRARLPRR